MTPNDLIAIWKRVNSEIPPDPKDCKRKIREKEWKRYRLIEKYKNEFVINERAAKNDSSTAQKIQ